MERRKKFFVFLRVSEARKMKLEWKCVWERGKEREREILYYFSRSLCSRYLFFVVVATKQLPRPLGNINIHQILIWGPISSKGSFIIFKGQSCLETWLPTKYSLRSYSYSSYGIWSETVFMGNWLFSFLVAIRCHLFNTKEYFALLWLRFCPHFRNFFQRASFA